LWAVLALHTVLLLAYTVALPTYRAPDEYLHVDLILAYADDVRLYGPTDRALSERVDRSIGYLDFTWDEPRALAAGEAPFRPERPTFTDLGGDDPPPGSRSAGPLNQMPQHPPGYYLLMSAVLRLTPWEGWAFDQVVGFLRLLNVVLAVPLPLFAFAAARRLTGSVTVALVAAIALLAVPQVLHIGGSVNNDNLFNLLIALLAVVLVYVALGDTWWRTGVWVGVLLGGALLTKGFALALPPWVAAAYLLGWVRNRRAKPIGLLVAAGLTAVIGGWWWVRNLIVHGEVQPAPPLLPPVPGFEPDPFTYWWDLFLPWFLERWWGSFGWIDTPLPRGLVLAAWAVLAAGVVAAFVRPPREGQGGRLDLAVLLLPIVLILPVVVYGAWSAYADTGIPSGIQGRYLFAGLVGVAVVVAAGYGSMLGRLLPWLPALALVAAARMNAGAANTILARYWGGEGTADGEAIKAVLTWSPWSGRLLAVGAIMLIALGLATFILALRFGRSHPVSPGPCADATEGPGRVGKSDLGHA
jgi:4-amino-4-deoxy-L-arabinose transferase-like glycosyltransferase